MRNEVFVIGIDGGGTKTVAVLANSRGKILRKLEIGSTNPNKIGFEKAVFNLKNLIKKISKGYFNKIKIAHLGLAGGLERDKEKSKKIEKDLQKYFPFEIKVEGDQKIAFRAGTNENDGIVIIAGTGAICMGWKGEKEAISGGWDWLLGDQGSAFWVGKKVLEEVTKSLDGRGDLKLKKNFLKKLSLKNEIDLYRKFYQEDFIEKVAAISKIVDQFSRRGDQFSKKILKTAGGEIAKMAISVIKKLNFGQKKFPIVLAGGMFKSKVFLERVKKEIRRRTSKAKFILLKKEPVLGAVRIALEKNFKKSKLKEEGNN